MPRRSARSSRRGLLAAAGVAAAGLVAGPTPRASATGSPLLLGEVNFAGRETVMSSAAPEASTLRIVTGERIGVLGQQGDAYDVGPINAGLCGATSNGIGVCAVAPEGARALEVRGRAAFARAGVRTIPQGMASYTIEDLQLAGNALILCELQGYGGPGVGVRYVRRIDETRFRVTLTSITTRPVAAAYFVFEGL